MSITKSASCEVRSVIQFLNLKTELRSAKIHRQLDGNAQKWRRPFNEGRTIVLGEEGSVGQFFGRKCLENKDML